MSFIVLSEAKLLNMRRIDDEKNNKDAQDGVKENSKLEGVARMVEEKEVKRMVDDGKRRLSRLLD